MRVLFLGPPGPKPQGSGGNPQEDMSQWCSRYTQSVVEASNRVQTSMLYGSCKAQTLQSWSLETGNIVVSGVRLPEAFSQGLLVTTNVDDDSLTHSLCHVNRHHRHGRLDSSIWWHF